MDLVESRKLPVAFPLEVRFAPPDDAFLGPSYGRESCYIAVHVHRGQDFDAYFHGVEQIMDGFGGRPHWGKRHFQRAATLHARYPEWDRFAAVRARLDPRGTFRNHYTDRVLGAVRAPARTH
jgi:L-gulonolactone oxidase